MSAETSNKRQQSVTVAKKNMPKLIAAEKRRIEREYPDPVMRLGKKGESKQPDLESSYSRNDLLQPPFSMAIMTKLCDLDPYLSGAIDAIATNVSACEMEVQWIGDGDENKKEREALEKLFFESHDAMNPTSLQEKIKACMLDFLTVGNWNLELIETTEKIIDLVHAPAEFVRVRSDQRSYVMVKNNDTAEFEVYGDPNRKKEHYMLMRAINKAPGHRVYGKPITFSLVDTVIMNSLRDERNLGWFDRGTLADLLIGCEENIDPDIKKRIAEDYQNTDSAEQALYIIDGVGKMIAKELKHELEGASFDKLEQNNRQRVLTATRVPPAKVAIFEDANRANTLTQDETFRNEVTIPIQNMFKHRFNHLIRVYMGMKNWEFRIRPLSLKDRKEEAEIDEIYTKLGVYVINDVLDKLGRPAVQGGDRRVMNTPLGLVDLLTWEIAVADPEKAQAALERLGKSATADTADFISRIIEFRNELQERMGHTCDTGTTVKAS